MKKQFVAWIEAAGGIRRSVWEMAGYGFALNPPHKLIRVTRRGGDKRHQDRDIARALELAQEV